MTLRGTPVKDALCGQMLVLFFSLRLRERQNLLGKNANPVASRLDFVRVICQTGCNGRKASRCV